MNQAIKWLFVTYQVMSNYRSLTVSFLGVRRWNVATWLRKTHQVGLIYLVPLSSGKWFRRWCHVGVKWGIVRGCLSYNYLKGYREHSKHYRRAATLLTLFQLGKVIFWGSCIGWQINWNKLINKSWNFFDEPQHHFLSEFNFKLFESSLLMIKGNGMTKLFLGNPYLNTTYCFLNCLLSHYL